MIILWYYSFTAEIYEIGYSYNDKGTKLIELTLLNNPDISISVFDSIPSTEYKNKKYIKAYNSYYDEYIQMGFKPGDKVNITGYFSSKYPTYGEDYVEVFMIGCKQVN